MITLKIDSKGRITLPRRLREDLGVEPGDVLFLDREDGIIRLAKAENPFDVLADHAIGEYERGETISLRDFAEREGIDLDE